MTHEDIKPGDFFQLCEFGFSQAVWEEPYRDTESKMNGRIFHNEIIMVLALNKKNRHGQIWLKIIVLGDDLIGWTLLWGSAFVQVSGAA